MPVIEIRDLKKHFGKIQTVRAIDGVSFEVEKGEIFGLVKEILRLKIFRNICF